MRRLCICNAWSDTITTIDLEKFIICNELKLLCNGEKRVGPHKMCRYNEAIIIADNFSNGISIVSLNEETNQEFYYIGMGCNDVKAFLGKAFIVCGDCNNLITFDLKEKKMLNAVPCGNSPQNIDVNKNKGIIAVANFRSDSVTLIDAKTLRNIKNLKVGAYPTKAVITSDGNYLLVCESNLGSDYRGSLSIISLKNFALLNRIPVGKSPVDFYYDESFCYVSNLADGTISVVDTSKYSLLKTINIGGMPRSVKKNNDKLYICDIYNNILINVSLTHGNKKSIPIGKEPTGMIFL